MRNDPYYQRLSDSSSGSAWDIGEYNNQPGSAEALIEERIAALNALQQGHHDERLPVQAQAPPAMLPTTVTPDPEMQQLEGMLDKILDIQDPGRAQRMQASSIKNKKQVFAIQEQQKDNTIQLLAAAPSKQKKQQKAGGFLEWSESLPEVTDAVVSVGVVVQETRVVSAGSTLKLRLQDDVFISGVRIPAGQFVYGQCSFTDDRLVITIPSIRYRNTIYPVALLAYDMDGLAGVYIPGAMGRDAAKNAAGDAAQAVDIYSANSSLTAQAATVGVSAAKSLLSKKARQLKVTVKAGYRLLLKDSNANE